MSPRQGRLAEGTRAQPQAGVTGSAIVVLGQVATENADIAPYDFVAMIPAPARIASASGTTDSAIS
jgi:hypothetical protein